MSLKIQCTTTGAAGTSFKATSNKVNSTPWTERGQELRDVIAMNKAFRRAFEPEEDMPHGSLSWHLKKSKKASAPPIILQSSPSDSMVFATHYGLVSSILDAYNRHHNLILRPDDVWQAILAQFSFYVNDNAEELRDNFVDFKGKKTLVVDMGVGTLETAEYDIFANRMVDEQISENLKDPEVTEWLLPNFSTTKSTDRVAASVTIMSTLQAYFEYVCCLSCGIPEVTLEGTPEDWHVLRQKVDRLPSYDVKGKDAVMAKWHGLLSRVLDQFVMSAEGKPDLAFWDTICSRQGGGSGPRYISGWATVFACFTDKGRWQGDIPEQNPCLWVRDDAGVRPEWPFIDTSYIPVGVVAVPVLVDDNGTQYDTQMLAGQFAYEVTGDKQDTIRPRNDWCIAYEGKPKSEPRAYVAGEFRDTSPEPATKRSKNPDSASKPGR